MTPRTTAGRALVERHRHFYGFAVSPLSVAKVEAEAAAPLRDALRGLVEAIAKRPCSATEFYVEGYPEVLPREALNDGVERCLDPEFNEMGGGEDQWPWDKPLERCDPCAARRALDEEVEG
jgi:hypothetical protein